MADYPKLIGHRGAAEYAPENTLAGLNAAAGIGLNWAQVNVKLSRDGIPLLLHDDTLERTTSGSGDVAETDWADIRELDAGSWFGESFIGEPVPTLDSALERALDLNLNLNIDIVPSEDRDMETAEAVLDHITRIWDEPQRIILSSFSMTVLEVCAEMVPDWKRTWNLAPDFAAYWQEMAGHLKPAAIHVGAATAQPDFVHQILRSGYALLTGPVNEVSAAQNFLEMGVHGFISDMPDILYEAFE